MTLLCRQNNQIMGGRSKTAHLGYAWHQYLDKNSVSYTIVTHANFPDEYANNFLKALSNKLYERNSDFRKNPQGITSLDTMARHVINELQISFDGSPNFTGDGGLDLEGGNMKAGQIQKTLNQVTGTMRSNLNKLFENQDQLNEMDSRSGDLRESASQFQLSSARLEKIAR